MQWDLNNNNKAYYDEFSKCTRDDSKITTMLCFRSKENHSLSFTHFFPFCFSLSTSLMLSLSYYITIFAAAFPHIFFLYHFDPLALSAYDRREKTRIQKAKAKGITSVKSMKHKYNCEYEFNCKLKHECVRTCVCVRVKTEMKCEYRRE